MKLRWLPILTSLCLFAGSPGSAMNNYDDPRIVLSYMDKSVLPARDILRLHTDITDGEKLLFQVKTRGDTTEAEQNDYALLQVWQDKTHFWLISLASPDGEEPALVYQIDGASNQLPPTLSGSGGMTSSQQVRPTAKRISRGIEYTIPLTWLDYGEEIGFQAYTVKGRAEADGFVIEEVYDRAVKGHRNEHIVSPIMLLNNLCATRK